MIHHADCIEFMQRMPSDGVDLVVADPPFNIGYSYDVYQDDMTPGQYQRWTRAWVEEAVRVLRPGGAFWVCSGDDYVAEIKVLCSGLGLVMRNWIIWHYGFGVNCTTKFSRCHTHLLYFVVPGDDFVFNRNDVLVPSIRQRMGDKRAAPGGKVPGDVWNYSRVCGTFRERAGFHGCQMPEQLIGRIVRACSGVGEVVFDPFVGSGTTPAVCKKLDRAFVGTELSEEYCRLAQVRVDGVSCGDELLGKVGE